MRAQQVHSHMQAKERGLRRNQTCRPLDRSLALSTETLFSATARVRPTLEVAYALQYLWASEHSRTVIVLITDTQDMFFGGMTLPEYKPRAEYP